MNTSVHLGIDIGSVTTKVVAIDPTNGELRWSAYRAHQGRQRECAERLLAEAARALRLPDRVPVALTGSGAQGASAAQSGAPYVQEVNALVAAVRSRYPGTRSVIELGGEDAKMMFFDAGSPLPFMNDKCAAGTGAMLDRLLPRLGLSAAAARSVTWAAGDRPIIAAKCGVFAETDVVNLLKSGTRREDVFLAILEAIVQQNLSALAHGHTPAPDVLLLGGPHVFYPALRDCWAERLAELWKQRGIWSDRPGVIVPDDALLLPAIGSILHVLGERGELEERDLRAPSPVFVDALHGSKEPSRLYVASVDERRRLINDCAPPSTAPVTMRPGETFRCFLGVDCGSTTIKSVLLDDRMRLACSDFAFATEEPIADALKSIERLVKIVEATGARPEILSAGVTGYARDLLAPVMGATVSVVETAAHARSTARFVDGADVICDVGGQDIKVMLLRNGHVVDFRLNTQCSAGTGFFLQSLAERFGIGMGDFAEAALGAEHAPRFNSGCAIFLQSDIVNYLRQGYTPAEIMAGVTSVLPVNIWVYAARIHDLTSLGNTFVLQGGTQRNAAAVRAQVQYIEEAFRGSGRHPRIVVHPHPGEAGAIGAALAAADARAEHPLQHWRGLERLHEVRYEIEQSPATRCDRCRNACQRTVIRLELPPASDRIGVAAHVTTLAPCDRGRAADAEELRACVASRRQIALRSPDFADISEHSAFSTSEVAGILNELIGCVRLVLSGVTAKDDVQIRMPRVLNMYATAPLFSAYFMALGVPPGDIIFSPLTRDEIVRTGNTRGTIDPCFPGKLCFSHVEHLLRQPAVTRGGTYIFFPAMPRLVGDIADRADSMACTVGSVMPEVVNAAFTIEGNAFRSAGMEYLHPVLSLEDEDLLAAQLYATFHGILGGTRRLHREATRLALRVREEMSNRLRRRARSVLDEIERDGRLGIVALGRPYHCSHGVNHGILEALNAMGFPVFTPDSLPRDVDLLERLFDGVTDARVRDVWPNPFSENSNRRVWAAMFAARHPNLLAIELSSFRCGHDAPMYSIVRDIFRCAGKPYFTFLDLDENRPVGSLALRIATLQHVLKAWERENIGQAVLEVCHEKISATAV